MERVLIVAKTHMKSGVCVSGLTRTSSRSIRLIPMGRANQAADTPFEVGQVWDLEFQEPAAVEPPHTEDVIVTRQQHVGRVTSMRDTLMRRIEPWRGGPESLFDRMLTFGPRKGYIDRTGPIPDYSTGYWLPDRPLRLDQGSDKPYYLVEHTYKSGGQTYTGTLSIPFVGFDVPVKQISSETLIRVSLARWLPSPDGDRCYLQLPGWYL